MNLKSKYIHLTFLNLSAIIFYFIIFSNLKSGIEKDIMFASPDSRSYLDVANWMENGTDSEHVGVRPFLFPLFILFSSKIGGIFGIWMMHFIFWLTAVNFIFLTIKKLTEKYVFAYLGSVIFIINLSVISLTLHALTEISTIFLLSLLAYFITTYKNDFRNLRFIHGIILFLTILTVIKPVFYLPLLFTLFLVLPVIYFKKYTENPKKTTYILLILIPLFIQLGIMKSKYDEFTVSKISSQTFAYYLLAQGIEKIEGLEPAVAMEKSKNMSSAERKEYLMDHFSVYSNLFVKNIEGNISTISTFLLYPEGYENIPMAKFMEKTNKIYLKIHYLFVLLMTILFILFLRSKDYANLILLLIFAALASYYIVSTGISFYQGDRLVLSSIAIWIPLYFFTLNLLLEKIISSFRNRNSNLS